MFRNFIFMEENRTDFGEIALQLSHPQGEHGKKVSDMMRHTNANMIRTTIGSLGLENGMHLLEIGPADAPLLPEILSYAEDLHYTGLEISEMMHQDCLKHYEGLINSGKVHFQLYDGESIPQQHGHFDRIFTVNTIYFYKDPETFTGKLANLLKPGGTLHVTFAFKSFMSHLPFVNHLFTLYEPEEVMDLLGRAGLSDVRLSPHTEIVEGRHGETVVREFGIVIGKRTQNKDS
jgi:SAM-dependent methyltransferase